MKLKEFFKLHPMFPVVILFTFAVSGTTLYLGEEFIALTEIILGAVLAIIVYVAERKTFSDLKKSIGLLNSYVLSGNNDSLTGIPLPFVVCTKQGSISWYNDLFEKEIIGDNELTAKQIRHFIPADKLSSDAKSFNANYNNKRCTVYVSSLSSDEKGDYLLFFIDDTYYKDVVDKFKMTRPVIIVISVDAMDEVSSKISQNEFSTLLSDGERIIVSWFTKHSCILRKTGDGKFFALAEYKTLEEMKNNKFEVLEQLREHKAEGSDAALTVSIGIATGEELAKCETLARKSLDMARGRGGDQVVINENDNYEFFGGVASGVESRNQVQSRIVASSVEELIRHSTRVFIMGHKNSDLDALGSAIGLSEIVRFLGIDVKIVIDEKNTMAVPLYNYYNDKNHNDVFITPQKAASELVDEDLVIITDVMRESFADSPMLCANAKRKVVIDHHRMSVDYIKDSLIFYHEPNSSSASEMVTELIRYMPSKPSISKAAAESLLSGIYLDTKNFTLKTGVRTFEAAAYLKDCGADTITVRKLFAATAEENAMISRIVSSAEIKNGFAFAFANEHENAVRLASAKAADELLNIEDVDASFVIFSIDGIVNISARSYGRVNVQLIMEALGGGGHQTMAAAQLRELSSEQAKAKLESAVEEYLKKSSIKKNKKEE